MRIFVPLRRLPIALLWGGLSLSAIGDQLYAVAITWIAVGVLGPNAGYLSALQFLVLLVAVLGIGRWADRWDHQRSMVGADLCRAAVLVGVVGFWLVGAGPSVAGLVAAVVVLAIGQAVFQPALHATLPVLVDDIRLLPAANGLFDATDRSARLLGPGIIALLAGIIPVVHFLTLDALSFAVSGVAIMLIIRMRGRPSVPPPAGREGLIKAIVRGVRAMAGHPLLGYGLATAGPLNGAWYSAFFLALPLLIERAGVTGLGGSGLGAFGMVISAYGCTNLAATVIFGSRALPARPQLQMFLGNLINGIGMACMGLAGFLPPAWLLPGLMAAASFSAIGGPMKDIPLAVLRQTRLRRTDVPAAMRAYMALTSAGVLVAMLLIPTALRLAGIASVIIACGAIVSAVGMIGLMRYAAWVETYRIEAV